MLKYTAVLNSPFQGNHKSGSRYKQHRKLRKGGGLPMLQAKPFSLALLWRESVLKVNAVDFKQS